MAVNVRIEPASMVEPMKGRRFAVVKNPRGWFEVTRPTSRNIIAQGNTAEELAAWVKKQGGKAELIE